MQIERTFTHQNTEKLWRFHINDQYKIHHQHYNHSLYDFNHQLHEQYNGGLRSSCCAYISDVFSVF